MGKIRISVIQTSSGLNQSRNLQAVGEMIAGMASSDLIALPEVFSLRGNDGHCRKAATTLNSHPAVAHARNWCSEHRCHVLLGSVIERQADKVFNTSVLLDRKGEIAAVYRKIHLFSADLEDGTRIDESELYTPGDEPATCELDDWICGFSICYDLRFPELFRAYADLKADIVFVPSNFTAATGKDHWEILLRARAIENQCWIIAPNQCGINPDTGVESYGHSMIINPWGRIAAEAGTEPCVITFELDPQAAKDARKRLPVLTHRRM
ncbi:MAG TPA: carbon-nitrogen hydrolase family protein [Kiritimatiellia bacterium]|nr:carbon-nitrogen hydrolase family protein [Kiritimatiellia bacterium]HNR94566.1 carbon-nitrogen hydrolase family protein [Kiritimatiellia bacterium]HNS81337.1 carbon-nitrogen hydrolase family protein [Kiritimatiellia bacterium]HPA77098.1 carbon-nitrogen hydrolase family protein [Kiritimatiellia bacterium]HQQ03344.1 carbon-nitrogen hydrolase family protein [Kiritimatiellia bacterium]